MLNYHLGLLIRSVLPLTFPAKRAGVIAHISRQTSRCYRSHFPPNEPVLSLTETWKSDGNPSAPQPPNAPRRASETKGYITFHQAGTPLKLFGENLCCDMINLRISKSKKREEF
jgi:hypothetical protein